MKKILILSLVCLLVLTPSCTSDRATNRALTGAYIGGFFGGALGGTLGGFRGRDMGTMVGMIVGGAAGAASAAEQDSRQRQQMSRRTAEQDRERMPNRQKRHRPTETYSITTETETPDEQIASCPLTLRNLRFVGEDGNQEVNREETCKIIFELANTSASEVRDIVPYVSEMDGNEDLLISPTTRIESVAPGDAIRYTALVRASKKLKEGTAVFRIAVSCNQGEFVTLRNFSVQTAK